MENKVRDFNRLPRPQHTPTGLSNHWVFVIRRVPFKRPSDLVLAIHPQSSFMYQAGPAQILPLSTVSERAEALIPFLFDIFIKCSDDPRGRQPGDPQPFAPWTWATEDPELSAAVENGLKQHGVRKDLCRVGTWSANEKAVVDETWSRLLEILAMSTGQDGQPLSEVTPGDRSRCHGCGLSADIFTETLKQCSACKKAWYHSQDCQRQHWKKHKPTCLTNRANTTGSSGSSGNATNSKLNAHTYYNTVAHTVPEAQTLLRALNLNYPPSPSAPEGTA